jgi:hypothetical protein
MDEPRSSEPHRASRSLPEYPGRLPDVRMVWDHMVGKEPQRVGDGSRPSFLWWYRDAGKIPCKVGSTPQSLAGVLGLVRLTPSLLIGAL